MHKNGSKIGLSVKFLLKYPDKFGGNGKSAYLCTRFWEADLTAVRVLTIETLNDLMWFATEKLKKMLKSRKDLQVSKIRRTFAKFSAERRERRFKESETKREHWNICNNNEVVQESYLKDELCQISENPVFNRTSQTGSGHCLCEGN